MMAQRAAELLKDMPPEEGKNLTSDDKSKIGSPKEKPTIKTARRSRSRSKSKGKSKEIKSKSLRINLSKINQSATKKREKETKAGRGMGQDVALTKQQGV